MSEAAVSYVERAFGLVMAEWFRADRVDWPEMRGRYLAAAADIPDRCHEVVEALLAELGDGHSHLIRPGRVAAMASRPQALPTGHMHGRAAYVDVPAFVRNEHVGPEVFAGRLQALLARLDAEEPMGWIVDLRGNGGGDMWPMLAGLGPLLGEGPFGFFVASRSFAWTYRDGAAFNDGRPMCRAEAPSEPIRRAGSRAAVLIGPGTASAGEAVGIAFRGRPGARSFGRATAGQATANSSHVLSDGAVLAITAAVMADRSGAICGRVIAPDVSVSAFEEGRAGDAALDRARAWLAGDDLSVS